MLLSFVQPMMIRKTLLASLALLLLWASNIRAAEKEYQSHLELGITVSSLLKPSIGYWWGRTGIRFSGMYLSKDHHEYHFNIGYVLSDAKKVQRSVNLLTSWIVASDPGADYRFASTGIAYGINYKGFFLELGLAVPWRDELGNLKNDLLVPCGYWGYIHRFK